MWCVIMIIYATTTLCVTVTLNVFFISTINIIANSWDVSLHVIIYVTTIYILYYCDTKCVLYYSTNYNSWDVSFDNLCYNLCYNYTLCQCVLYYIVQPVVIITWGLCNCSRTLVWVTCSSMLYNVFSWWNILYS